MSADEQKPPTGRPFGPGNRGKPGRRKGARNVRTIVHEIAVEKHKVKRGDKIVTLTVTELVLLAIQKKAMGGHVSAARYIDKLRDHYQPDKTEDNCGLLVVPGDISADEWVRRAEIIGRFAKPPDGLYDLEW